MVDYALALEVKCRHKTDFGVPYEIVTSEKAYRFQCRQMKRIYHLASSESGKGPGCGVRQTPVSAGVRKSDSSRLFSAWGCVALINSVTYDFISLSVNKRHYKTSQSCAEANEIVYSNYIAVSGTKSLLTQ